MCYQQLTRFVPEFCKKNIKPQSEPDRSQISDLKFEIRDINLCDLCGFRFAAFAVPTNIVNAKKAKAPQSSQRKKATNSRIIFQNLKYSLIERGLKSQNFKSRISNLESGIQNPNLCGLCGVLLGGL